MPRAAAERIRKTTTLLLAIFLWLHAIFFLSFQSATLAALTGFIHLTTSEIVLFVLLALFSALSGAGFWRMLRSLAYIYFFPFVVIGAAFYLCALALRSINTWFISLAGAPKSDSAIAISQHAENATAAPHALAADPTNAATAKKNEMGILQFLLRPFQRFMILWCILLLVTTHTPVVWLCLVVVLAQLARKAVWIVKLLFFSDNWWAKYGLLGFVGIRQIIETLEALDAAALAAKSGSELKTMVEQLKLWKKILDFLKDPYLMARWGIVVGFVIFGSIYTYFALLFSFAYYGICRVSGVLFPWSDAFVTSEFIPFFVAELPKLTTVRLLGGIHCSLVVVIGVGTAVNFFRRKLDAIRAAANELSNRLAEQRVHQKYLILEQTVSAPAFVPTSELSKKP